MNKSYRIYILQSMKDFSFYIGISTDPFIRLEKHNSGKGAKYTKTRVPLKFFLVSRNSFTKSDVLKEEYRLKQLNRKQKEKLIEDTDFWLTTLSEFERLRLHEYINVSTKRVTEG